MNKGKNSIESVFEVLPTS